MRPMIQQVTDTCYSSLKYFKQSLNSRVDNYTTNRNISLNNLQIYYHTKQSYWKTFTTATCSFNVWIIENKLWWQFCLHI